MPLCLSGRCGPQYGSGVHIGGKMPNSHNNACLWELLPPSELHQHDIPPHIPFSLAWEPTIQWTIHPWGDIDRIRSSADLPKIVYGPGGGPSPTHLPVHPPLPPTCCCLSKAAHTMGKTSTQRWCETEGSTVEYSLRAEIMCETRMEPEVGWEREREGLEGRGDESRPTGNVSAMQS